MLCDVSSLVDARKKVWRCKQQTGLNKKIDIFILNSADVRASM